MSIGNGVLQACSARSHFKLVKAPFFHALISTQSGSRDKIQHSVKVKFCNQINWSASRLYIFLVAMYLSVKP